MVMLDSKEDRMLTSIGHLKELVPRVNLIYKYKEILKAFSAIWICQKEQDELLGPWLKGGNLLLKDSEIRFFLYRQNEFKEIFSQEKDPVFCNYVYSVVDALGNQHDPNEWLSFIDSSKVSLKAVRLRSINESTCVPLLHAADVKETNENIKLLLEKIQCGKI